ncbi:methylamine utilization protein MauE [Pseudomonas sp. 21615526]|uniref:MauE/DoxX family redox-associated membrane protein n=1 Tax=unclassified Pseudomonas TaxID=196821 RepID=UPI000272D09A|nr:MULTISPECIES: MauE/DoxX family redox-associated membrane protein [unclassified Pseudomonas]EJF73593.1 methylamine utilization MauE [Pseudomonas sp. Ag1]NVZ37541.1 methylamine utilization protein MauE [Pseudomonas sp. 21615526]NWC72121.1 methylamine utilization protein MauE [Pseudomonas sp. P7758]
MHIDPIFIIASALAIAVLLASAATHKLRAPARFARQLADYQLLPEAVTRPAARVIPLLELVIAFALLVPASRSWAALGAAGLIALYAAAIGINLWRGRRDIDCGCAGPDQAQPLRPILLLRNGALVAVALLASVLPIARDLGFFDGFVTVAASAVALLIYAAADGLLANSPLLLKLIGR